MDSRHIKYRWALVSLVAANAITIMLFILNRGSIMDVLWIYWLQSGIIGVINLVRILTTTLNIGFAFQASQISSISNVKPLYSLRWLIALFFIMSYGLFHVVFMFFLLGFTNQAVVINFFGHFAPLSLNTSVNLSAVLTSGLAFAVHHGASLLLESRPSANNPNTWPSFRTLLFRPFARILPMYLIILIAPFAAIALGTTSIFVVFMLIKTVADLRLFQLRTGHPQSSVLATSR